MHEELLTEIGLTKSEIAVYFALLEIGSSTTGPIIKKAGIASGKAYLILDRLVQKGLVTYSITSGTKYYQAKDPERLVDYLKEKEADLKNKEEQLQKIIPALKAQYEEKKYEARAEIFEGVNGFKTCYEWLLKEMKPGETLYILGVSRIVNEKFSAYLMDFNKRRIEKKIKMRIIYTHDSREFGKLREKMPLTEVRYMKKESETPAWIDIYGEYVLTLNVQTKPLVFLMKDKITADSYRKYFEMIWKVAVL